MSTLLALVTPAELSFELRAPGAWEWLALLGSYLLGAVPFGFVLARSLRGVDLREVGSGNIGATNAMRVLGKGWGAVAFLLDLAKGFVPVQVFAQLALSQELGSTWIAVLCGAAAVCGHVWPVYLGFKGGKAVATGMGAIIAIDPVVALGAALAWVVVHKLTGYVSLASLAMGVGFPSFALMRALQGAVGAELILGTSALAALILVRHRSNIARLLAGTEVRSSAPTEPKENETHA